MDAKITKVVKEVKELLKPIYLRGNATYSAIDVNGGVNIYTNRICFGAILGGRKEVIATALMRSNDRPAIPDSICKGYFQWLFNDSPYSRVFISKDPEEVFEQGYILVSGHHPANLVLGGLQATRRRHEYNTVAYITSKLIDVGFNGNLAYAIAHQVGVRGLEYVDGEHITLIKSGNQGRLGSTVWGNWFVLSDHLSLDCMTDLEVVNFCKSSSQRSLPDFCGEVAGSHQVKKSWVGVSKSREGVRDTNILGVELFSKLDGLFNKTEAAKLNPFLPKSTSVQKTLDIDTFIERVIEIKDDLYKIAKLEV